MKVWWSGMEATVFPPMCDPDDHHLGLVDPANGEEYCGRCWRWFRR